MKIRKVKQLRGTVIEIVDSHHTHHLLNVAHWAKLPICNYKELLSHSYLSKVRVSKNGRAIEWPNGQEIAPEDIDDFSVPSYYLTDLFDFSKEAVVSREDIVKNETVMFDGEEAAITLGWKEGEWGDEIWMVTLNNSVWMKSDCCDRAALVYELLRDHIHEYTLGCIYWEVIDDDENKTDEECDI